MEALRALNQDIWCMKLANNMIATMLARQRLPIGAGGQVTILMDGAADG